MYKKTSLAHLCATFCLLFLFFGKDVAAQCYSTDIKDMSLDITEINWTQEKITATINLSMTTNEITRTIVLDAKGEYTFHSVTVNGKRVRYTFDSTQLRIMLRKKIEAQKSVNVKVVYTVHPTNTGGSAAITEDKGLYFINGSGETLFKPRQLWSQGETESNSKWFPTHDRLSCGDKFTGTISILVEYGFVSLSNGLLKSSVSLTNGFRRDTWRMNDEMSSYLYMIALGDFAIVQDKNTRLGIPVKYYVEKQYAPYAKRIFRYTPEMIDFFSDQLNVLFPWSKYSQIVIRDYVSGAMENTSAVTFTESLQGTNRELDNNVFIDIVVPHELFHHWFGDLATARDWGNLTLNEGFATLSEQWWINYKYGSNYADVNRKNWRAKYFAQCYNEKDAHPLIDSARADADRESMFDAHSYQKGGLILHMLQCQLGDTIFRRGLMGYLTWHSYRSPHWTDLRHSFEQASGQDLNGFFDQWFLKVGHPILEVSTQMNQEYVSIAISQKQVAEYGWGLFDAEIPVKIYFENGSTSQTNIHLDTLKADQLFYIWLPKGSPMPEYVALDEDRNLLVDWRHTYSMKEYEAIYYDSDAFMPRYEAADSIIVHQKELPNVDVLFRHMMSDKEWRLRYRGAANCLLTENLEKLRDLALNDDNYEVRRTSLQRLPNTEMKIFVQAYQTDTTLEVLSAALQKINTVDSVHALLLGNQYWIKTMKGNNIYERYITAEVAKIFARTGDWRYFNYYKNVLQYGSFHAKREVQKPLEDWMKKLPPAKLQEASDFFAITTAGNK